MAAPVIVQRAKAILRTGMALVLVVALVHRQNVTSTRKLLLHSESLLRKTSSTLTISKAISSVHNHHDVTVPPPAAAVASASVTDAAASISQPKTTVTSVPFVERDQRLTKSRNNRKGRTKNLSVTSAEKTPLPPLDSLIGDLHQNVTGDVQSLLDFAIVGFGKCGTTALINWLDDHPEINTIPKEALHLSRQRPALMVQKLYQMKVDSWMQHYQNHSTSLGVPADEVAVSTDAKDSSSSNQVMVGRIQGFKNPSDIRRPEAMIYLRQHWPETKLIVTVRHPVHWFKSLYNFLLNEMGRSKKFLHHTSLIGGPHKNTAYAHTGKGEFHAILSLLGKTPMDTDDELELLQGFLREEEILNWPQRLPNKIFFLDTAQMSDTNETRAALFRQDLGLEQALPPVLHVRPGKDRKIDESLKIDMCRPENDQVRHELLRISQKASLWFRKFFLESEDVVVSSREYLDEIFATTWMQDPCDEF